MATTASTSSNPSADDMSNSGEQTSGSPIPRGHYLN